MQSRETQNVYKTYDKVATWFAENRYAGLMEKRFLDDLLSRLPADATVLDLGCGTGVPILQYLVSKNVQVTGVDASYKMLELAQQNFPDVKFILQDMRQLDLGVKFDAIIAWHSFFHLPSVDQPAMFKRFAHHLHKNGILIFTSGTEHGEAWGNIGGEDLFHASLATAEYEKLLINNNFEMLQHVVNDAESGNANVWVARYNR